VDAAVCHPNVSRMREFWYLDALGLVANGTMQIINCRPKDLRLQKTLRNHNEGQLHFAVIR